MSHPMYNPFNPGKRMRPQGPYVQPGGQMEMDPRRPPPHPGAGSNSGSSGSTVINCGTSGGPITSLLNLPINYRPERSTVPVDKDIDQHLDLNISRAREEAMQNSASQNTQFTNVRRDTFPSTNTGMQSYLPPPAAQVNRPFTVERDDTSLNWASVEESSKMYPSAPPTFLGSGEDGKQSFVGLGNYDTCMSDKSAPPWESIHSTYTSEPATDILQQFGLLREDLHRLTSYPGYQITPDNLPFILRQIRLEKETRAATSVHSTSYDEAQPMRSMGEMDELITSRGPVLDPDQVTSTVVKQSKVIDYGHSSKSELPSFGQLNKDTDLRQLMPEVPAKNPGPAHQAASETQLSKPPSNLIRGVHPGRPGLVLIGSNVQSHDDNQHKSTRQASKASDLEMKNKTKGGPKQQLQRHQGPPQPAKKPPPRLQHIHPAPPNPGPSKMDAMTRAGPPSHLPPLALMEDCSAATPRLFPHTCSLCIKQCINLKDWLSHQNTGLHLGNTTLLRDRYPEWDGRIPEFLSASALDCHPKRTNPGHNLKNRQQTSFQKNVSRLPAPHRRHGSEDRKEKRDRRFSHTRSQSPLHQHGSESRRGRWSSRSRSPHTSKHILRPPSDSYDRQTSSHYRSRSRSYDRLSSPRTREAKRSSPRRSYERRSSPRRSDERRLSLRRSHERRSSRERSVSGHRRSGSADRLAKRILGKKAVQSLSKQSDLEAMVKTLAPVLLAELVNLKSSAASSSSKTEKKTFSHKSSKGMSSRPKSGTSSSTKPAPGRPTSPCMVNFSGVFTSLSYTDMVESMEKFGKVKSLVMYRSTKKARVIFEKAEDAEKLQCLTRFNVKGLPISVDRPLGTPLKKSLQKAAPQKKSGVSSSETTKSHVTVKVKKLASSETKNTTAGKFISKAKVLVSKAKGIATKKVSKTVGKSGTNAKSTGKTVGGKNQASVVPKSKIAGKRPPAKAKKPVTNSKLVRDGVKSAPNKASQVRKQPNKTIAGKTSTSKPKTTVKAVKKSAKSVAEEKSAKSEEKSAKSEEKSAKSEEKSAKAEEKPAMSEEKSAKVEEKSAKSEEKPMRSEAKLKKTPVKSEEKSVKASSERQKSPATLVEDRKIGAVEKQKWSLRKTDTQQVSQTSAKASAESSTITSVGDPGKNAAELPHVDDNSFKALTAATNKNRLTEGAASENRNKQSKTTPEDAKQENPPHTKDKTIHSLGEFDELDFYSGDFVTVDEINEDVEDMVVEDHSSSPKPTSRETKDKQSSASRKTSTNSSSSKSSKGNSSSRSTSSSANKQKSLHESKKSETKTRSARGTKSSSSLSKFVKTPPSSGQKSQSNQSKPPIRSSKPSSVRGSVRSPASATKSSVKTQSVHKKDVKPTQGAVATSDHHVSAESCSAKKNESVNEMKKTQAKDKKNGNSTEETTGNENKQVLNSVNEKSHEQKNKDDNQDRRTEIQISGPEQDHVTHQGADNDSSPSVESQEIEVDESTNLQDGALIDQTATADDGEEVPTMTQVSENDETKEAQSSDRSSDKNQVTSEESNQTPNSSSVKQRDDILLSKRVCESSKEAGQTSNEFHDGSKDTLKDQKLVVPTDLLPKAEDEPTDEETYKVIDSLDDQPTKTETESERATKDSKIVSGDLKPAGQGQSKSKTSKGEKEKSPKQQDKTKPAVQTKDSKTEKEESLEDFEEMDYEVVDSIEDDSDEEPSTSGSCSRRQTPRGNKKDEKASPPVEEPKKSDDEVEEMFTVLDSVEEESPSEKPVVTRSTRGRRQNTAKKVEENTKTKEDKTPTRRCTPIRNSKEKEKEKTPKKDVPLKESTPTKKSDSAVASTGDEDTSYMELNTVEYDQPTTQKPRRGRPKDDNKSSKEQSEEGEEPVYQIVDSLEEDQENTMTVESTLQKESETKVERTADVNIVLLTKAKEDKSPTRRRTPARDAQEKDGVCLKECAQTKKSDTAGTSTGEGDDTCKQLNVVKDGQPTTQKSRRGKPKKDNKTSKQTEEEEPVYQIVDSLEEDQENTMTVESSLQEHGEPKIEMTADFNTVFSTKLSEDKTLTGRQCTPTRDSHEKVIVPLKESTPTQTSNGSVANTGEEDTVVEELDAVEDDQPTTQKPGRGRPKKKNKTSNKLTEEEESDYQIVDTAEDDQDKIMMVASTHLEETVAKVEMTEDVNTVLFSKMKKDKILTRGQHTPTSGSREKDIVPLKESTPTKKSDAAVTSTDDEDSTYEESDAAGDDQPTTQKPGGRPKKDNNTSKKQIQEDEEPAYQIVDSLGDQGKNVMVESSVQKESEIKVELATNTNTDLFTKTKEDKNLTKRRHTPAKDSQENDGEKTPKPDVCVPPGESTPTDAVEEEAVEPATRASRRGRPKKDNKTSKKQTEYLKDDEEEATYQILDSVEDEVVDDVAPRDQSECAKTSSTFADDDITKEMIRSLLNEEEGGTIYQIVDSLEEDQVQEETMTETAMQEERETTGDLVASTDHVLSSPSTVGPFGQMGGEKETQLAGKPLEDKEDPSAKGSDTEGKEDVVGEDESLNQPNNHLGASEESTLTSLKSKDTEATENILVNLDQVSEDEEDYPDDAAEEEELKKRQAAAQKRENDREEQRSRERETRERRSRSSSRGGSRNSTWEPEKTSQEDLEKVEVDAQDLVTLDEVGEDEVGEEAVREAPTWEVELTEGELQDLVTLDEIVEEEEGQLEASPQSVESQSKDSLQPETSSSSTETTQIEDNRDDDNHPKEPSSSSKRKLDDTTEESGNFVTVDEVGEIKEEEEKEAVTRKGRPRKRSRQTPVRKSTRGKTVKDENYRQEEEENKSLPSASLDSSSTLDTTDPSGDAQFQTQRTKEGKNIEAASNKHQPLHNDGLRLGCEEAEKQEHRRADATAVDKRKQESTGPEAKRSRSQSPSVSVNLQLPPFNPKNPLGKEFVNPTSGFFCSLCSVFYLNEETAKEIHCSSQEHYDNLKNYYQTLQQNVQGSLSD